MPTPFPGMDPYLEQRGFWEQVHTSLIVDIQRFLLPLLRPHYHVAIEQRTYLAVLPPAEQVAGIPDVLVVSSTQGNRGPTAAPAATTASPLLAELPLPEEITERYLEVRHLETGQVVTVIEILLPTNKLSREGRDIYEETKRLKVLGSLTHLVEIDLIRAGQPLPMKLSAQNDYRIVVSRSHTRPQADVYLFSVRDPIPDFPIPLRPGETEPVLPLNQIFHNLYDQGGYDLIIDYRRSLEPSLSAEDAVWARQLLAEKLS